MKITINSLDLENVTIDTYQMFTGESAEEYERESMKEEGREDWDTVDITYNHDAIVKALAHESINYVTHELTTEKPKIVESITYTAHGSPKFYNYTTDYYIAEYECNTVELHNYIAQNYSEVYEKAKGYDSSIIDGNVSKENLAHAGLCHYIDKTITRDDYNMHMWGKESECYDENQVIDVM